MPLSANPGMAKEAIVAMLEKHEAITPDAIAEVILANNQIIANRINTELQRIKPVN